MVLEIKVPIKGYTQKTFLKQFSLLKLHQYAPLCFSSQISKDEISQQLTSYLKHETTKRASQDLISV